LDLVEAFAGLKSASTQCRCRGDEKCQLQVKLLTDT